MVKHTQTVRRQTNCLNVFDHFLILALEGLTLYSNDYLNIGAAELRQSKTRSISFYVIRNLLYDIKVTGAN